MQRKIILGIDPGTRVTGYGLIACENGKMAPLDFGCIRPHTKMTRNQCYLVLFNALEMLFDRHQPSALAIEMQFVYKNPASALTLGMAKGMAILAAEKRAIPIFEYTPKKAKLAVAGSGAASKQQVQKMIQLLLGLSSCPEPHDAADALALAICHAHTLRG